MTPENRRLAPLVTRVRIGSKGLSEFTCSPSGEGLSEKKAGRVRLPRVFAIFPTPVCMWTRRGNRRLLNEPVPWQPLPLSSSGSCACVASWLPTAGRRMRFICGAPDDDLE